MDLEKKVETTTVWYELYTREKLRGLEAELARRRYRWVAHRPSKPPAAVLLRGAGRVLRRLGEGLESWGAARSNGASDGEIAW